MAKKTIEKEINEFLEKWNAQYLMELVKDLIPISDLYDADDENDWIMQAVGEEDQRNIRLIRTVYLISRLADFHAGKLCSTNINFKNLWKRTEREVKT